MIVTNVMAASIDGYIASEHLEPDERRHESGFTSEADREFVREQIKNADAIITGADSMRASSGAWEQKGRNGQYPHWMVYTNQGLGKDLDFWKQSHIPRTLVSPKPLGAMVDLEVKSLIYGSDRPGAAALDYFSDLKIERILLFGGGFINKIFYNENLVDELKITLCPTIIGLGDAPRLVAPTLKQPVNMYLLSSQVVDNFVFLHYRILKNLNPIL